MEVWIPYGHVEALLTIQIENLGELVDPKAEKQSTEVSAQLAERLKDAQKLVICDNKGATFKSLKTAFGQSPPAEDLKVYSPWQKEVERSVPQLKGRVSKLSQEREKIAEEEGIALTAPAEMHDETNKLFLSTAEPDPFFGLVDARIAGCLVAISNSRRLAYARSETNAPRVFQENPSYDALLNLSSKIQGAAYLSVVPRGGEPYKMMEDGGPDKLKREFVSIGLSQTKGIVIAPGGRGYDDTLSHAIRSIWSAVDSVRKSGAILLIAECGEGIGSQGLEMYLTGRISEAKLDRVEYADGLEEVEYVRRLKNDYSVTLLSTLPEVYVESKLGFRVTSGANEGLGKVLSSLGRTSKMNVITRACEALLTKA
ncbi:MAG: hypothetical protein HYU03_04970 [Thaumarchaeota archaeon]|nr:hypothetical protein [Nitrososphaerota archaeon]